MDLLEYISRTQKPKNFSLFCLNERKCPSPQCHTVTEWIMDFKNIALTNDGIGHRGARILLALAELILLALGDL